MTIFLPVGWDLAIYQRAIKDLQGGLDPYVAGLLYPPSFVRLLRIASVVPAVPRQIFYWLFYAAGFGAQLWAGFKLAMPSERRVLQWALPLIVFFPGFMPNEVILCGNIAIPIYGIVLAAAVRGWERDQWGWFYLAVVAASLVKPPYLGLLSIPLFGGRKQIFKSASAAGLGVALFAAQKLIWSYEFGEYLGTVQTASVFRNGAGHFESFGFSAAGVLASALRAMDKPFVFSSALFYLGYGSVLFALFVYFRWQYRLGRVRSHTWLTVLLLGTFLLSPRILQYDALPATVPMFLLVIRGWKDTVGRWIVIAGFVGAAAAFAANRDDLEVALAMWALLVSGLLGLYREVHLSKRSVGVESGELLPAQ